MSSNPNIPTSATDGTLSNSFVAGTAGGAAKTPISCELPVDVHSSHVTSRLAARQPGPITKKKTRARSCTSSAATASLKQINSLDAKTIVVKDFTDAKELRQAY